MILAFALKFLTDLCYFMFAVNSLSSCAPHSGLLVTSPLIIALAAYFCRFFSQEKFLKYKYLRFAPLALTAACFIFTREIVDIVVTIPMILYLAYIVWRKAYLIGYEQSLARFYLCLKITLVPFLLMAIASNWDGLRNVMIPYFLFFFILSVMLLRMLRHNDRVIADRRFRIINLAEIVALCGLGLLLSGGYMVTALKWVLNLLTTYIFRPILTAVVYIFGGVAWLFNEIFSGIDFGIENVEFPDTGILSENMETEGLPLFEAEEAVNSNTIELIATYVLISLGAILAIVIIVLLFRAFMKAGRRERHESFEGVREDLDEPEHRRAKRLTRSPRDRVRNYYRKFIKLINSNGCDTDSSFDTRDISRAARSRFYDAGVDELREIYAKARYTDGEIPSSQVSAARSAYNIIKKSH